MAKRKTPKTDKVIDLTPRAEKINEQQLAKLQATIKTIDQLTVEIGQMEIRKIGLIKAMENVQNQIEEIRKEFVTEYGTDNINIQDGTIAYPQENQTPESNGEVNSED